MPNVISDLVLSEVSLVDRPANAEIDPLTGRKLPRATIALFKRDSEQVPTRRPAVQNDRRKTMSKLETILKKATPGKNEIADAVEQEAEAIQKRDGGNLVAIKNKLWTDEAVRKYEAAPPEAPTPRPQAVLRKYEAELEAEKLARGLVAKSGTAITYEKALDQVLLNRPDLYEAYEIQKREGKFVNLVEKAYPPADDEDETDETDQGECGNCGENLTKMKSAAKCPSCGADLTKAKGKAQARTAA